jgi:GH25 family lysozyme M1 (1,4-beta-N-acetylmuramidase)
LGSTVIDGVEKTYKRGKTMKEYTPWAKHILTSSKADGPILGIGVSDWMNRQDVRAALNIKTNNTWNLCGGIDYFYQQEGSVWIYPVLKSYGYKALIYSGDTDGAVPTLGTRRWIANQNWNATNPWRPWVTNN